MTESQLDIEVACSSPERQLLVPLQLPRGSTARDAIRQSGLASVFPELDLAVAPLAVFGVQVADDYELQDGDRVDVLRPLQRDPRDARRELAARGQTMASRPPGDQD